MVNYSLKIDPKGVSDLCLALLTSKDGFSSQFYDELMILMQLLAQARKNNLVIVNIKGHH